MSANDPIQALLDDLEQKERQVRLAALSRLRHNSRPEVVRAVIRTLRKDRSPEVQAAAAECLGTLGDPAAGPALMVALQQGAPQVRRAAITSLRTLISEETLQLFRLTDAQPDPGLQRAAARAASGHSPRHPWERSPSPVERLAIETLTHLRDYGDPDAIQPLCATLQRAQTATRYLPLLLEALVSIARRHPDTDLTPARETVRKLALTTTSPTLSLKTLRELETLAGSTLPIPAETAPAYRPNLPLPAARTAYAKTLLPVPLAKSEHEVPPGPVMRQTSFLDIFGRLLVSLWLGSMEYQYSHRFTSVLLIASPHLFLFLMRLMMAIRYELPTENVRCTGRQITVTRRLGPLRWRRKVVLPPGRVVYRITQKRSFWRYLFTATPPLTHIACLGADGRPFRFAHSRKPEELDRLAAEINAYLEQQETCPPAPVQPAQKATTEVTQPVPVNRHAR